LFLAPNKTATPNEGLGDLILDILQDGEMSGFEIAKKLRKISPLFKKRGEATLYPTLYMLEEAGSVEAFWLQVPKQRRRRVYRLKSQPLTIDKE